MFRVDLSYGFLDPIVEIDKIDVVRVCGLVERIVAGDEWIPSIMLGQRDPEIDHSVLELLEIPELCLVGPRVGMPILVLATRNSVEVKNNIQILLGTKLDDAVEQLESLCFVYPRVHIVFKVAIVERHAYAIYSQRCKEFDI
jgi:hypothetical protein